VALCRAVARADPCACSSPLSPAVIVGCHHRQRCSTAILSKPSQRGADTVCPRRNRIGLGLAPGDGCFRQRSIACCKCHPPMRPSAAAACLAAFLGIERYSRSPMPKSDAGAASRSYQSRWLAHAAPPRARGRKSASSTSGADREQLYGRSGCGAAIAPWSAMWPYMPSSRPVVRYRRMVLVQPCCADCGRGAVNLRRGGRSPGDSRFSFCVGAEIAPACGLRAWALLMALCFWR